MVKGEEQMLNWSEYPFLSQVSCGRRSSSEETERLKTEYRTEYRTLVLYFGVGGSHTNVI